MAFWGKKKQKTQPIVPVKVECSHKWRDFPWYLEGTYDTSWKEYTVNIIEPYVCVWCGKRQDKTLHSITRYGTKKDMQETVSALMDTYGDHIKARAFIENDIADMQLVDREYLRALAIIKPEALVGMDEKAQVALKKS